MKVEKGLFTDSAETDQPVGTYRHAKNLVDSNTPGAKETELGFTQGTWGAPYTTIGTVSLITSVVVFSTDDTNCEIGEWANNVYTTIYNDPGLNFDRTAPIKGEFRINTLNQREVYWIDDVNSPRMINIDDTSLISSVADLDTFQTISNPELSTYSISNTGGALSTAAYIIITQYQDNSGAATSWFIHDKVFYINDDPTSTTFNNDDGSEGGIATNKSINLSFTGCDTNFDTIVVGFVKIANQVTTAYKAITKTLGSTVDVTLTGSEALTTITVDEVLTPNGTYSTAKAITQVNNQLILANLTSIPAPNFQPYAAAIQINWTADLISVISNTGTHKDTLSPVFMPGEVYAFYIGLELNKGGWVYYHIPGRPPVAGETASTTTDGLTYLKYQVDDTTNAGGATTNMGYWENVSETYPNDTIYDGSGHGGVDLRGINVRHHRMPNINTLEATYTGDATVGVTKLIRLRISASNVNIPAEIQSEIKRWKIFFAKKSSGNSIVGGSDLLQYPVAADDDTSTYWTTAGNWKIFAGDYGYAGEVSMSNVKTDALLGHCLDHLYAPGEFTPDFAWFPYTLTSDHGNDPYTGFGGQAQRVSITGKTGGFNNGQTVGLTIDYTVSTSLKTYANQFRKINNYSLLPQNAKVGVFKSAYAESYFTSTITPLSALPSSVLSNYPDIYVYGTDTVVATGDQIHPPGGFANTGEETVFMLYGKVVSNAHTSFTAQTLVPLDGYASPSDTTLSDITGGDTFLCYMSYMTAGPLQGNHVVLQAGDPYHQGFRIWRAYLGYSRRNWNFRYQIPGTIGTYHYGKTSPVTLYSPQLPLPTVTGINATGLISSLDPLNQLTYNPDYNQLNELEGGFIYSVDTINADYFPDLIIWSVLQGSETSDVSWRIFPADNRYTIPKDTGEITNVQGINNRDLFINTRYALYKTRTDVSMQGDAENIRLRSNALFEIVPEKLVPNSTGGYCGTQNKFSCILTKAGYFFVDDLQGKVFLVGDNGPDEISTNGMRKFFRDNMGIQSDNPFYTNGYTAAYDEAINRIILAKKHTSTPWTISYNPEKKIWVSYHDYEPDVMFTLTGNKFYSIKSNAVYQHNVDVPGKFYSGTVYPMSIDVVHNPEPDKDKVFVSANWLTESYNSSGVLQYLDTFNYMTCRSLDYCTNRIALVVFTGIDTLYTDFIRNINRVWYYNDIRDISTSPGFTQGFYQNYDLDLTKLNTNMEWYDQRKFTDKFVICRLEYSNSSGNRLLLLDSGIEYRYATK